MADRGVTLAAAAPGPVARRLRALPWWGAVLVGYAASRVVTTALMLWVATQASPQSRAGARPSLLDLSSTWDGAWYRLIAQGGYPSSLPLDGAGEVATNQWAFLPVYPALANALTLGVLDWRIAGVLLSVASGAVAAVLLGALLTPHVGRSAVFAAVLFSCSPLSFVLQMTYAEALGLALLLGALLLVDRRRYGAAIAPAVVLAFTRPGAPALALAIGLVVVVRALRARRTAEPVPAGEVVAGSVAAVVTAVAGFAWSGVAALATGRPDAYVATEGAWRALWLPHAQVVLFEPWAFAARFWAGTWFGRPGLAPLLLVVVVGGFAAALVSRPVRRLGLVAVLWCASYALYLLAVFFPQSSLLRLLMPMAPLAGAAAPRRRAARVAVLASSVALQALWMWVVLGPLQLYWTVL